MKTLLLCAFLLVGSSYLLAEGSKKLTLTKDENWLKDQNDETDTYAIPLDNSEEEEEEEEAELNSTRKDTKDTQEKKKESTGSK